MFPLRVVPWWTDEATRFLVNLMKWYPKLIGRRCRALEAGGGNSTLFLLSKGIQVTTLDDDGGYIDFVRKAAEAAGASVNVTDTVPVETPTHDLTLVCCEKFDMDKHTSGSRYKATGLDEMELGYDFLINDGFDRMFFLQRFRNSPNAIIVLDNCERAANWGRLPNSAGNIDLIKEYRSFLRDPDWNKIQFEQGEGREGRSVADVTGAETISRTLTAIAWHQKHPLTRLMVSNLGFPLTNFDGLDDKDLETVLERCPFDWDKMQWVLDDFTPESLNLGLDRSYD